MARKAQLIFHDGFVKTTGSSIDHQQRAKATLSPPPFPRPPVSPNGSFRNFPPKTNSWYLSILLETSARLASVKG